jgi:hypothetical protein
MCQLLCRLLCKEDKSMKGSKQEPSTAKPGCKMMLYSQGVPSSLRRYPRPTRWSQYLVLVSALRYHPYMDIATTSSLKPCVFVPCNSLSMSPLYHHILSFETSVGAIREARKSTFKYGLYWDVARGLREARSTGFSLGKMKMLMQDSTAMTENRALEREPHKV